MAEPVASRHVVNWNAAVVSGLIAGVVFLVLEMLLVPLALGGSPWGPPRMIAAIALGRDVLPTAVAPATFDGFIVLTAMVVHFLLSIVYALVLAPFIERVPHGTGLVIGVAFGLALYFVNFYGFTAVFPWFAMARNWVTWFSHVMFGAVGAWTYYALRRPKIIVV
jgi:uncharacterized membrane protein YagU involved in acid resistance